MPRWTRLVLAIGLAVIPSLPFLASDAVAFLRFHNWALFVGGLILGSELRAAHAEER